MHKNTVSTKFKESFRDAATNLAPNISSTKSTWRAQSVFLSVSHVIYSTFLSTELINLFPSYRPFPLGAHEIAIFNEGQHFWHHVYKMCRSLVPDTLNVYGSQCSTKRTQNEFVRHGPTVEPSLKFDAYWGHFGEGRISIDIRMLLTQTVMIVRWRRRRSVTTLDVSARRFVPWPIGATTVGTGGHF